MTNTECAEILAFIADGCGKVLTPKAQVVYFDCLSDLDFQTLQIAAKRVLMEHRWATFPSIAELREAAAMTNQGAVCLISPVEAWEMAWGAIRRIDMDVDGSVQRATKDLPALVVETMDVIGIASLVGGKDPVPVVRAQFLKAFESLAARDKRQALMPGSLKAAIENRPAERAGLTGPAAAALAGIGKGVE